MKKKPTPPPNHLPACSSQIRLPPRNLTRLHRAHLGDPPLGRQKLAHSADLVRGVAGDADVVVALEDELDVADLEGLGAARLGALAGGCDDLVDELVGDGEDALGGGG